MLSELKKLIAIFGMVAFLISCLFTASFAGYDRDESRYSKHKRYDSYTYKRDYTKRHTRSSDSDADDDRGSDSDSDSDENPVPAPIPVPTPDPTPVPTPDPTPVPTPDPTPVPTPDPTPVPTPDPTPVPTPDPTPVPTPEPTPIDGAAIYNQTCANCHGQSNYGKNVPSGHIGSKVNLTPAEIDAVNAL